MMEQQRKFWTICLSVFFLLVIGIDGFSVKQSTNMKPFPSQHRHSLLSMKAELAPRKALFFEIVESGLNDRFKEDDVPRVFKFCQFAKGEIPSPSAKVMMHDPCEEYIDDLEAKPWWNKEQFDWVAGLEAQSTVIGDELREVLAARELFKGDSRYQNTMGEGWTAFRLQRLGQWNEDNVKVFPKTSAIIRSLNIPLAVRGVMFAKQAPGIDASKNMYA
jgi:hypothetical protein